MNKGLNYFDAIIYINLDHRTDRNEALLKELERLQVAKEKIHRISAHYEPLNGHKGCALSHAKASQYAIDQKFKNALILEDDFVSLLSSQEIEKIIDPSFNALGMDWDVFLMGGTVQHFEKTSLPQIHRALFSQCAHAYAVNNHYFQTLTTMFLYCYKEMASDLFFIDSPKNVIDYKWNVLMAKDRWYFNEIFAQQTPSYSDIQLCWRDGAIKNFFKNPHSQNTDNNLVDYK